MANAEQFGRLSLSFGEGSLFPTSRSLPASNYYYCCHRGSYRAARSLRSPLPPSPSSSPAACSRYNESCHLARLPAPPAHTSLSRPTALPMHCSAFELEAKAKGPPACVRDDNALEARRHRRRTETERKEGRKKEDSHCEKKRTWRREKLNKKVRRQAMNMDEIST